MEKSGLDLYFIDRNGENFKASLVYAPYFYLDATEECHNLELMQHLQKRFENCRVEMINLEDLDMPNHLSGKTHQFLKISFGTVAELVDCKSILRFVPLLGADFLTDSTDHMCKAKQRHVGMLRPLRPLHPQLSSLKDLAMATSPTHSISSLTCARMMFPIP
jgi:hypothetical protein